MQRVWHTKTQARGLTELAARHEKHDGAQDKSVSCTEFDSSKDVMPQKEVTPEKVVMLYAHSIEWLYNTLDDNVGDYTEVFRDLAATKEGRGLFRVTFTVYLYGPLGG